MRIYAGSAKLWNSENDSIKTLRENDYVHSTTEAQAKDNLLKDAQRGTTLNGKAFDDSLTQAQLDTVLRNQFGELGAMIKNVHAQTPMYIPRDMVFTGATDEPLPPTVAMENYTANYFMKDGQVYLDLQVPDISIRFPKPDKTGYNDAIALPGAISMRYAVSENGYKAIYIDPSNSLLESLCLSNASHTQESVALGKFEVVKQSLMDTLKQPGHPKIQHAARNVLKAAVEAQKNYPEQTAQLAQALDNTQFVLNNLTNPTENKAVESRLNEMAQAPAKNSLPKKIARKLLQFSDTALRVMSLGLAKPRLSDKVMTLFKQEPKSVSKVAENMSEIAKEVNKAVSRPGR